MSNKGIKAKLILSLIVTTLLVLTVFFVILNGYLKDYSRNEAEETILFLGQITTSTLQRALYNSDYNQLQRIVQSIIVDDFDYLLIYDNVTGNVAFTEDKKKLLRDFEPARMLEGKSAFEKTTYKIDDEMFTRYLFPITETGVETPLGFLIVGVSQERIRSKLVEITIRLLIISILLFFTLALIIYFLSDKIVKPIKNLSIKIGKFAAGDYAVRSDIKTGDEIGNLSENFNIMADKINEQILSIEGYSKNLEKMVEERTEELSRALTSIKEKDRRLNHAAKINSLNSIVSSIAHEINNPLAIISGNIQLIDTKVSDETLKKKLNIAHTAIGRIANLIDEINFFAAIKDITLKPLPFSAFLENAKSKVVPEDIHLTTKCCHNDIISTNEELITISLENILKNSVEQIRFREIEGKIAICSFWEEKNFIVEITDNAGGFKDITRAFDPFYTTFNEKKGLGLTFVHHAIQALNGDITADNLPKGAGAVVRLKIPESTVFEKITK